MRVFRERLLICMRASFRFGFGFWGGMKALIVVVLGHCLYIYIYTRLQNDRLHIMCFEESS